jgi:hypothetical protein
VPQLEAASQRRVHNAGRKAAARAREIKTRGALDSAMDAALVERLEAAVARLEAAVASGASVSSAVPRDLDVPTASDPAIVAYDEFVAEAVGRVTAAAEKIGGKVLDATKVLAEAFAVAKDLLVQAKQLQVPYGHPFLLIRSGRFACATRVDLWSILLMQCVKMWPNGVLN